MSDQLTEEQLKQGYPRLYSRLMMYKTPFHLSIWDKALADFFNQESPQENDIHTLKPLYESFLLTSFDAFKPLEIAMHLQSITHFDLLLAHETATADFNSSHNALSKILLQKTAQASGNPYFISHITIACSGQPEYTSTQVPFRFFDDYSTPPRSNSANVSMQSSRANSAYLARHSDNDPLSPLPPPFDMALNFRPDAALTNLLAAEGSRSKIT